MYLRLIVSLDEESGAHHVTGIAKQQAMFADSTLALIAIMHEPRGRLRKMADSCAVCTKMSLSHSPRSCARSNLLLILIALPVPCPFLLPLQLH